MTLLLLLLACGDKESAADDSEARPASCDSAPGVTWDNWGDGFFATYCRACHSANTPARMGAPESINFDTEAEVRAQTDLVRSAVLERESMPVGGGVYEEDLYLLDVLLTCGL